MAEPAPKRPMVPSGASDWEPWKPIIRELYMEQNLILNEVIKIMITEHNFKATARMYKGQFAKWKWTKYNKSGKASSLKPAASRASKKRTRNTQNDPETFAEMGLTALTHTRAQDTAPVSQHLHLQYFNNEQWKLEAALNAYGALVSHWCQQETPWRIQTGDNFGQPLDPDHYSILQYVRSAQDHFLRGRPDQGGEILRLAFLGIEGAIQSGPTSVEALWDCCLAVPQLALNSGWTDVLTIFTRYLHQYTTATLTAYHPLTKVAAALHTLSSSLSPNQQHTLPATAAPPNPNHNHQLLTTFIHRAWQLWIDRVSHTRGRYNDVTIHLKRGYVTLIDPTHKMAGDIISGFALAVQDSLTTRGIAATTGRILELEDLLVKMYLPLFTPETSARAEQMLLAISARIHNKEGNRGKRVDEWGYVDRYLVFSADWFLAALAEYAGDHEKAAWHRWRSLDSKKDLFWLQTSILVEARLRAGGNDVEAEGVREARALAEAQLALENGGMGQSGVIEM